MVGSNWGHAITYTHTRFKWLFDCSEAIKHLWSLDHLGEYAKSTAELTKLAEDVLLGASTAQKASPIVIDAGVVKEVEETSDRATRYGIPGKTLDVGKAVERSFTAASAGSN
jgi:sulfonate transport system substrate-binding protein